MQLSVVVLAAGQGTRTQSDLPKVLLPLAGRPLVQHVLETAAGLAPASLYVVYGYGGAQVQAAVEKAGAATGHVDWILQADQLGTGHAVMQAMPLIPDDHLVLVLYGDVPLMRLESLRQLIEAAGAGLALLSVELANPDGYGRIVRDVRGQVSSIVEDRDATPEQLAIRELNTGLMAAPAKLLRGWLLGLRNDNTKKEYYLTDVVAAAVADGVPVHALRVPGEAELLGINDKIQLAAVEAAYRRRRANELMLAGATLADPARIDVRGSLEVGRDAFIDVNAVFSGRVTLGPRVKIGPNCVIRDAQIGADTEVFAHCVIDGAVIGARCQVGPFARLRPGATLHDEVHVGNFVEVKNSVVGERSKANHLTYLGDTRVGVDVNVGAGTISCNYDGANKWPTLIEDRAFIGSGSMLVAPVKIGAGATVGAGSTITANVPAGELTLTRARQTTVAGWTRPAKYDAAGKAAAVKDAIGTGDPLKPDAAAAPSDDPANSD
jgi:bifunctional UDP-N-acetylglucosamine pyrophosphorylase/glucosamine-1-phosphate N-acetyltransferase